MRKFLKEFKAFITKGNVMDLSVGVIIGAAFKDIVTSLTDNIISPILGLFGKADLSGYSIKLNEESSLNYGAFLTSIINFLIMAFIIFMLIKIVNSAEKFGHKATSKLLKGELEEEPAPTTKICPYCKSEIAIDATRCPHCTSELE